MRPEPSIGSDSQLGGPIAAPATLVPGVAQNVSAGADLAAAAAAAMSTAASALDADRPRVADRGRRRHRPRCRPRGGTTARGGAAGAPRHCAPCVGRTSTRPGCSGRSRPNSTTSTTNSTRTNPASQTRCRPSGSPRRCSVATARGATSSCSPRPSRHAGIAGFPGNYAVVTVDDGRFEVTAFGRRSELDRAAYENGARCDSVPAGTVGSLRPLRARPRRRHGRCERLDQHHPAGPLPLRRRRRRATCSRRAAASRSTASSRWTRT